MEKFPIFDRNHRLTPLEKSRFFDFFNFLILESEKAFFPSQNIFKHVFLFGFDKNKNMEKFPIFDRNHRLTPLGKSQFFNFFDFLILESKNTFFLSRILSNIFCWLILPIIKKMENFQIFDQNHGVTPLEKCQFLDFLTFCFLQYKKAFFSFKNIVKHIFLSDFAKNKKMEKFQFFFKTMAKNKKMEKFQIFYQNHGLSPLEKSRFFDFFNFLIFQSKNTFFLSRILSNIFCWLILPIIKFLTKTME